MYETVSVPLFAKYIYNVQVWQDEMGRAYGMNGAKRNMYVVLVVDKKERDTR
jgi:hypothetical protein